MQEILSNAIGNISSPPILFFMLGFAAAIIKSDLFIPEQITKAFSIYFMMAIGFKGGVELSKNGITSELFVPVTVTVFLGVTIPILAFYILKSIFKIDATNSGAVAAHYGSVSVVTFVTAVAFLIKEGVHYNGFMVGMMAIMESPAIFISILLVRLYSKQEGISKSFEAKELIRESLFNSSIVLLLGSMIIGYSTGTKGMEVTKDFFVSPFYGILCLFLLEMGILAGKRINEFKLVGATLISFALIMPIINALIAIVISILLGLKTGNTFLFAILCASASYIAAPAAVRLALPKANPSYYITMSLALTFPFNITFGIPLYYSLTFLIEELFR